MNHPKQPTCAEINLSNLKQNLKEAKRIAGPGVAIMAAVKCDAYGHGAVPVSKTLAANGVDMFGVATFEEAMELKAGGIRTPILILFPLPASYAREIVREGFRQNVSTPGFAAALSAEARKQHKLCNVHIEIDTGMNRTGVPSPEAAGFIKKVRGMDGLVIEGLSTHFSTADSSDKSFAHKQLADFRGVLAEVAALGINIRYRHASNSAALMGLPGSHFNMVRPGLMLYGMYPSEKLRGKASLKPVMSLRSSILMLRHIAAGSPVSYGRRFTAKRPIVIATVPAGYGDGYRRGLSGEADVLIRGRRHPVAGTVCMDQLMVDLGIGRGFRAGDEVVLLGRQGRNEIRAEELAGLLGTIPYEITCGIGKRVARKYVG